MIRVAVADDQPLVRDGIRMILDSEPGLVVVGEAAGGAGAIELVARQRPDVLLLDVQMPAPDGLAALRAIVASGSTTRVLMLTTFDLDEYVFAALRTGAVGFLLKDMPGEDLVTAVRQAARGCDSLLAPAVTRRLIARFVAGRPSSPDPGAALCRLTGREQDVLRLIAEALSNAEIAARLSISETTVKTHVARVLMKLGLRDRVQAAIYAHELRLGATAGPGRDGSAGGDRWPGSRT